MSVPDEEFELVRGGGNLFRDLGRPDAAVLQLKADLASRIIAALDGRGLTVRQAQVETGIAAADFSRIRNARLDRFTIDRLMTILGRLGEAVEVTLKRAS